MTRKTGSNWSQAEFVGSGMMYVTSSNTGTIYYTDKSGGTAEECFLAKKVVTKDGYSAQIPLNSPLDKKGYAHPFIAPDGGYIIFDYQDEFFISFKRNLETWTAPVNLSRRIRGNANGLCAYVSPDERHLFFSRFERNTTDESLGADIYWVDAWANIAEELKGKSLARRRAINAQLARSARAPDVSRI